MGTVLAEGTSEYVGVRFQKLGKLYHFRVVKQDDIPLEEFFDSFWGHRVCDAAFRIEAARPCGC